MSDPMIPASAVRKLVDKLEYVLSPEPPDLSARMLIETSVRQSRRDWWREGYAAGSRAAAKDADALIADAQQEQETWRSLLLEADSMLSAYGYGRAVTKAEAIELSARIRNAYERR